MTIAHSNFRHTEDLPQQRMLYKDCFPESHVAAGSSEDHYHWKFQSFPAQPPSFEYAAWEGRELLGYYAALPFRYSIRGRKVICGMVCDVMTHSRARGRGVFTGIGRHALAGLKEAGIGFVSGYPIRPEVLPGHLKVGWKVAFDLPLYAKALSFRGILGRWHLGFLAPFIDGAWAALSGIWWRWRFSSSRFQAEVIGAKDIPNLQGYEEFRVAWSTDKVNFLVKDSAFLAWRLGTPGANYALVLLRQGSRIMGLGIGRLVDFQGLRCFALMDFMVRAGEREAISALHGAVEKEARHLGADLVVSMMSRSTARRLQLFRHGFFRSPAKFQLILNRLDPALDYESLLREENWDLMWIDSDDN